MAEVIPFQFPRTGYPVRTLMIKGAPWFVALDVAAVLDLGNPRSSLARLDDDEKGVHSMDTLGGEQKVAIVNESGLYSMILRSRKEEAKAFKRWITHDVLPSIRQTGSYSLLGPGVVPITLSFPETAALIRQHWGLNYGDIGFRRVLRSAGVLKQGMSEPMRAYESWFWFNQSCWQVFPHAVPLLAHKIDRTLIEARHNPFVQTRLDIDGDVRKLLAG